MVLRNEVSEELSRSAILTGVFDAGFGRPFNRRKGRKHLRASETTEERLGEDARRIKIRI
jgi:hypothetical protein